MESLKVELKANTLTEAYRLLMFVRHKSFRDVASEAGVHLSVAWRFSKRPNAMSMQRGMKIVEWMAIAPELFISLWNNEFGS